MLKGKKILLGISGSIAAYKTPILVRELIKNGAEVKVIASTSALDFVTPLTLATVSNNPVLSDFTESKNGVWNNHVELGLWADIFLIAPASANTIAKMANGLCDNLLLATYLSAKCPVFVAPAMDLDMYQHPSFLSNLSKIQSFGNQIIEATYGELASGLIGKGRMEEPVEIVAILQKHFEASQVLKGKKVMITTGPTYEALDPVRYIGNHSSGKMGFALAECLAEKGAEVHVISGPSSIKPLHPTIKLTKVTSAAEMFNACLNYYPETDISIFAAAVADYTPKTVAQNKIKKNEEVFSIELIKTKDIAKELGLLKKTHQLNIGFALETNDEIENATKKLASKNLDFVVLNSMNNAGAGFQHETNQITILDKKGQKFFYELKHKKEVANDIVAKIIELIS
jgi:phosphopantothenoylcysteine decarboxylase / phosphopantothenate---cysteine ligase